MSTTPLPKPSWWPEKLTPRQAEVIAERGRMILGPVRLRFLPPDVRPTLRQEWFLRQNQHREVFYGGAAGGGKSAALLMAALQYADVPGYNALLLRRSFSDLELPGALIDMAARWLAGSSARWNANKMRWSFPSGATLNFGYLEHEEQKRRYASAEFQFIGFDELTHFSMTQYTFLFSRLRKPVRSVYGTSGDGTGIVDVPLRMRSASNPGGRGHEWVNKRFVDEDPGRPEHRRFVSARLEDNPHLDQPSYIESLGELTTVELDRLLHGDWTVSEGGGSISRSWFTLVDRSPFPVDEVVRYWDMAATEATGDNDPDYTVGTLYGVAYPDGPTPARYIVLDVVRGRWGPGTVEQVVKETAIADGPAVSQKIEQEPSASGKLAANQFTTHVLDGFDASAERAQGDKVIRARVPAAAAEQGRVYVVKSGWTEEWLQEMDRFPRGGHDDQVDSWSGAHLHLNRLVGGVAEVASAPSVRLPLQ